VLCRSVALLVPASLTACSLPADGPSKSELIDGANKPPLKGPRFVLMDVDMNVVTVMEKWAPASLHDSFGTQRAGTGSTIGIGDTVQIMVWEAAAGGLFSAGTAAGTAGTGSRTALIPEQEVGSDGAVTVPYAGRIQVAGRSTKQVEEAIVNGLTGKAIEPQALVTVVKNVSNTVTVIGDVTTGGRIPLTARGDRILDVVAQAGGIKSPAYEIFLSLVRDGRTVRIPMQTLLANPAENVFVKPGDLVNVAKDPQVFTAVGATETKGVVPFDAAGISLDQAIAKAGGLSDERADPAGVFVIRYESPSDYDQLGIPRLPEAVSRVPVIYRLNMRDPGSFFLARQFPMHNKDILFVSNASSVELQKIVAIITPFIGTGATIVAAASVISNYSRR
jgi:polysaccharide export outer membrane protein